MDLIAEHEHRARKEHRCDNCGRIIRKGERYTVQVLKDGDFWQFKSHNACLIASRIVYHAAGLFPDEGLPLVSDMETEDLETIAEEDQDVFIAIWGSG